MEISKKGSLKATCLKSCHAESFTELKRNLNSCAERRLTVCIHPEYLTSFRIFHWTTQNVKKFRFFSQISVQKL